MMPAKRPAVAQLPAYDSFPSSRVGSHMTGYLAAIHESVLAAQSPSA